MNSGKWIVLLGAPGCGKGTQSELLVTSDFSFKVICVGDILRSNLKTVVPQLGKPVGEIIGRGTLLPDDVIVYFVKDAMSKMDNVLNTNLIFDGFPRTIGQGEALAKMTKSLGHEISHVINFEIDDVILTKRVAGRSKCKSCEKIYNDYFNKPKVLGVCDVCGCKEFVRRKDDNEEVLKNRLSEYYSKTKPLIEFYKNLGLLFSVNADAETATVYKDIIEILSK